MVLWVTVIHSIESKCKAEFITDETISACVCEHGRENDFYGAVKTLCEFACLLASL